MGLLRYMGNILFAIIVLLPQGCVKDSLDGCVYESGVILQLKYNDSGGKDIMSAMMTQAGIYIFNTDDELVAGRHIDRSELYDKSEFALPPGDYYALAWGNRPFSEPIPGQTVSVDELYVRMVDNRKYHYAPVQALTAGDYTRLEFTVPRRGNITRTLEFMPVYLSVDVWIYDLEDYVEGVNLAPTLIIGDTPDGFDFFLKEKADRDDRMSESEYTLSPDGGDVAYGGFTLPYFYPGADNDLQVFSASDGTCLVTVNLLDFILENDLAAEPGDLIEIFIRFSGDVLVEIGIPEWSNRPVTPEV